MKKQIIIGSLVAILCAVVGAVAIAQDHNDVSAKGAAMDTYTFPDGTVVRSAYISNYGGNQATVYQIKQANGVNCYGLGAQGTMPPAIACTGN